MCWSLSDFYVISILFINWSFFQDSFSKKTMHACSKTSVKLKEMHYMQPLLNVRLPVISFVSLELNFKT